MKSFFLSLSILTVLLLLPTAKAIAAKPRVRATTAKTGAAAPSTGGYSSVKLSRNTNSIVPTFKNLANVDRIEYLLSYVGSGVDQGVAGTFVPSGQGSESRDLYLGTCSHGVCTAHYSIKNATLLITTRLKSGVRNVKRYRIKI